MPEVQEQGGQGEAKGYTESGAKKAKGGEEMNREDVVQAALKVERWCDEKQDEKGNCDCPFGTCKIGRDYPSDWNLETFLRTRGLKDD